MKISTKGRYALRVMLDLSEQKDNSFVSLKEVAERQGISMKYLEMIISLLNKGNLVESQRGKNGGYRLKIDPKECSVGTILKLVEGDLAPVSCIEDGSVRCEKADQCKTLPLWEKLDLIINQYLESVSLADLEDKNV